MRRLLQMFAIAIAGASPLASDAETLFMGLGDLPGGPFRSLAFDISADGSTVVGESGIDGSGNVRQAFRWTPEEGMVALPPLGQQSVGNFIGSRAAAVSADGSTIVGTSHTLGFGSTLAVRWTAEGVTSLGDFIGGDTRSLAFGLSADGSIVVGQGRIRVSNRELEEAFRWTEAGGMTALGVLGDLTGSTAEAASADGTVIVGSSPVVVEAFAWRQSTGIIGLGDLPGGFEPLSAARDVSADGTTIVGNGSSDLGQEAFRWTQAQGMQALGDLAGGGFRSIALAVSADGSIVVGQGQTTSGGVFGDDAFIWDAEHGMRELDQVLADLSADIAGWTLEAATGVSDDGRTVVGSGTNPNGDTEAWIAVLPEVIEVDIRPHDESNRVNPMSRGVIRVAILGSDALDVDDIDPSSLAFGPDRASPVKPMRGFKADVNRNGFSDLVLRFRTEQTGIAFGDTEACVTGETLDGVAIVGCDLIVTVPRCGGGFASALVLPPAIWVRRRLRTPAPTSGSAS